MQQVKMKNEQQVSMKIGRKKAVEAARKRKEREINEAKLIEVSIQKDLVDQKDRQAARRIEMKVHCQHFRGSFPSNCPRIGFGLLYNSK